MRSRFLAASIFLFISAGQVIPCFATILNSNNNITADTAFKLASPFQSNMVLQQQKPFSIWGKASAGNTITIKADWTNKAITLTADDQHHWKGEIPVPKAIPGDFKSHTLTITTKDTSIKLSNLLIGEVWLASGQSNMQYKMQGDSGQNNGVLKYEEEVAAANYPNIRLLLVKVDFKAQPNDQFTGDWVMCSPQTVKKFSGVAYYFGRELYRNLNVPVGIILSTIGASPAQAWTSRKELESDTALYKMYLKPYDDSPKSKEVITPAVSFEKVARPTLLYNAIIYPLTGFSLKGIIWYQGESNRYEKATYANLLTHMIEGWRKDFGQGELPFYYVLLPPYIVNKNETPQAYDYAAFREAQFKVRDLKNTEMAILTDLDEIKNLHPRNKKPVGERLAKIALHKDYHLKDIPYLGPQFKKVQISGNMVKVSFYKKTLAGGLTTLDNQAPKQFFIAGSDKIFHEAIAVIDGDQVILKSDSVSNPVAVRFEFTNSGVTNLINKAGLPAEPFRTDSWEPEPVVKKSLKDIKL